MTELPDQYSSKMNDNEFQSHQEKTNGVKYDIDDALLEFICDYISDINNNSKINLKPDWYKEYTLKNIPNWKIYYFHFKSLNRCVIYLLINYVYCDGEILCRTLHQMYQKMNGRQPVTDQPKPNSSKSSNDEKEMKTVDKNRFKEPKDFIIVGVFDSIKQLIIKPQSWDDDPKYPSLSHNVANQSFVLPLRLTDW